VLFERDGRHFLVTATHAIEQVPQRQVGIPVSHGPAGVWTIGSGRAARTKIRAEDVTVVELTDAGVVETLKVNNRAFLTSANIHRGPDPGRFVVFGYPSAEAREKSDSLHGIPIVVFARAYTGRTDDVENVTISEKDMLLEWQQDTDVRGISGAPIWGLTAAPDGPWIPEQSVKLMGVETGVVERTWIRGTRWFVVERLFDELRTFGSGRE
jgi:hypothetical protein